MLGLVLGIGTTALAPQVGAINVFKACPDASTLKPGETMPEVCKAKNDDQVSTLVTSIINILLFAIGTIAVIMIIVGGIRYTLSNGDASQIKSAKDTILYSVIGLVVSLLAFAIVSFVVGKF